MTGPAGGGTSALLVAVESKPLEKGTSRRPSPNARPLRSQNAHMHSLFRAPFMHLSPSDEHSVTHVQRDDPQLA